MTFNIDWVMAGGVIITGLFVVFSVLLALWLMVTILGKIIFLLENKMKKPSITKIETAVKPQAQQTNISVIKSEKNVISQELLAVIAAAVASMGGGRFTLRSISKNGENRPIWSSVGIEQNTSKNKI